MTKKKLKNKKRVANLEAHKKAQAGGGVEGHSPAQSANVKPALDLAPSGRLQRWGIWVGIVVGIIGLIVSYFSIWLPFQDKKNEAKRTRPRLEVFKVGFDPMLGDSENIFRFQFRNSGNRPVNNIKCFVYLLSPDDHIYARGSVSFGDENWLQPGKVGIYDMTMSDSIFAVGVDAFYSTTSLIKIVFNDIHDGQIDSTYTYGKFGKSYKKDEFQWNHLTEEELLNVKSRLNNIGFQF